MAVLIAAAAALAIDAARTASACYDEPKHFATGVYAVTEHRFLGDDNGPLVVAYGWPALVRDLSPPPAPETTSATGKRLGLYDAGVKILVEHGVMSTLFLARLVSVLWFVLLLALVAIEGRRAGGALGSLLAVALAGFSPTLLAHAGIVSADLPLAACAFLVLVCWNRYDAAPGVARAACVGAALGAAILAKLTGGVFALGVLLLLATSRRSSWGARTGHALAIGAVLAGVLWLGTAFDLGQLARQFELVSHYGRAAQNDWFRGRLGSGSLAFYPAVLAFKLEPAALVAVVLGAAAWYSLRASALRLPVAAPVFAALLLAATMASGYRQGIRFLLPMFPLLAVAAAPLARLAIARPIVAALVVLQLATAAWSRPDHLAYWNPLAGGPSRGDRWFTDSNHDWGQDLTTLADWQRAHPEQRVFGALYSIVPPDAYGVVFGNLLDDPRTLPAFDASRPTTLVFSVTLLRALAATPSQPLHPIARVLAELPPDVEFGRSIRGYSVTPERIASFTGR